MPPSTATLEALPDIENLRRLTKSIAMLDAILSPEWELRYYSHDSKWGPGEEMASMRNGCGDDWFLLFDAYGAALKGFAHEYPLAGDASFPARIQELVPSGFASFLREPAFDMEVATFCLWRRHTDRAWSVVLPAAGRTAPAEDGSAMLLHILEPNPEAYLAYAAEYFERELSDTPVRAIYQHQPLSEHLVTLLNPELTLAEITNDALEIGYPLGNI